MKTKIIEIKKIRQLKNLTSQFVAEKLGISFSTYGKIERGETGLTIERLYQLAEIFNMKAEDILAFSKKSNQGDVKYIPVESQFEFLLGKYKQIKDIKTFNLPFITGANNYMISAENDSMFQTININDKIIIEKASVSDIKFGKIYTIITKKEMFLNRVYSHKESSKIILFSDNLIYEAFDIQKKEIKTIWEVKGLFDGNLSPKTPFFLSGKFNPDYYKNLLQK